MCYTFLLAGESLFGYASTPLTSQDTAFAMLDNCCLSVQWIVFGLWFSIVVASVFLVVEFFLKWIAVAHLCCMLLL